MNKVKISNSNIIIKILFGITSIFFVLPSLIYLFQKGTIYGFNKEFCFFLNDSNRIMQTIVYLIILTISTILYSLIIKRQKEIFKDIKQILIFTGIICCIFLISIPFTSSDVFYYLGIGRLNGEYNQNPYYVSIEDFVKSNGNMEELEKDTVLMQGYNNVWKDSKVVYGPIWTVICKIVATLSLGSIDLGILVFRIVIILIHILNCYLMYKISNRKIFAVMYGLNPYMLLEGIMNLHNDIFVICFMLLALYFLVKKKRIIPAIVFLAMATAIKYFAILALPLFVMYHFKEEKVLKRLLRCIQYGLFFALMFIIPYLIYVRDLSVFSGIFIQQAKWAKNFYIVMFQFFDPSKLNKILLIMYILVYFVSCVMLLFKSKIKFDKEAKQLQYFIIAFLFVLITNFQPWYIMWLFPLMIWQKSQVIRLIIQISLISQFANSIFLAFSEGWQNGIPFTICMILGTTICICSNNIKKIGRY